MIGKLMMAAVLTLCGCAVYCADPVSSPARPGSTASRAVEYANTAEAARLLNQREVLILQIQRKRMELLRSDPKLKRLHDQMMQLARAIALELDSKREMRQMADTLNELNGRIDRLSKK